MHRVARDYRDVAWIRLHAMYRSALAETPQGLQPAMLHIRQGIHQARAAECSAVALAAVM